MRTVTVEEFKNITAACLIEEPSVDDENINIKIKTDEDYRHLMFFVKEECQEGENPEEYPLVFPIASKDGETWNIIIGAYIGDEKVPIQSLMEAVKQGVVERRKRIELRKI
jgi:hypothetical protein